jgi:hypothetical protein
MYCLRLCGWRKEQASKTLSSVYVVRCRASANNAAVGEIILEDAVAAVAMHTIAAARDEAQGCAGSCEKGGRHPGV